MHPLVKDMTGQQFGRLTVIALGGHAGHQRRWVCRCECGAVVEPAGRELRAGLTKSCGCLRRDAAVEMGSKSRRHGHAATRKKSDSPTYNSWRSMIKRCTDPNHVGFARYGGRGIKVDPRWLSFEVFLADMGERPVGKSLDRYPDNDGNYEAGNCRWATAKEQTDNSSSVVMVTMNGKTQCIRDWCRDLGIGKTTVSLRMLKGMSLIEALTTPVNKKFRRKERHE